MQTRSAKSQQFRIARAGPDQKNLTHGFLHRGTVFSTRYPAPAHLYMRAAAAGD